MILYFMPLIALSYTALAEFLTTYRWRSRWRTRKINADLQNRKWTAARYLLPAILGSGAAFWYESVAAGIAFTAAAWLGILATHTDLADCKIPKEACWWTLLVSGICVVTTGSNPSLASALAALIVIGLATGLVALLTRGGLGSGDVRLLLALTPLAAWSGYVSLLYGLLAACFIQVPLRTLLRQRGINVANGYPFAPALLIGFTLAIMFTGLPGAPDREWVTLLS